MVAVHRARITVLLVEDMLDAREILAALLEMHGLHVIGAATAAEALAAGRNQPAIDVLLADLHLPDGSGREVAEALTAVHPAMRSLFVSGDPPAALGARQAFLRKPVRIGAILGAIESLMAA
jgi:CheY-like chemotaxis protein